MTSLRRSSTVWVVALLAVAGCVGPRQIQVPADRPGQPHTVPVEAVQPHAGDIRHDLPDPAAATRTPGRPAGANDHPAARPGPDEPRLAYGDKPDLAPPGQRSARRPQAASSAPASRKPGPAAAAVDIIETGLAAQGLQVHDATAEVMQHSGRSATVRVTALHRLNGPPRLSLFDLDLQHRRGVWTVVTARQAGP